MKKLLALVCVLTLAMGLCSFARAEETITLRVLAGQSTTDAGIEDMIDAALAEKYPSGRGRRRRRSHWGALHK